MPMFEYQGYNTEGGAITALIDAENIRAAKQQLKREGIYPTEIYPARERRRPKLQFNTEIAIEFVSSQDLALMTRQFATLVGASIPLVDALTALGEQIDNTKLKRVISEVRDKVQEGVPLADALATHPKYFKPLFVNMIRAGESSGALDVVLERLALFTEKQVKLTGRVTSAMVYPIIMGFVGVGLVSFLLIYVIPKVSEVFDSAGQKLPIYTRLLISLSSIISGWWWLFLLVIVVGVVVAKRRIDQPAGRARFDALCLRLPLFGKLIRKVALSRFSSTLATLLGSGVPLVQALEIVAKVVNNAVLCRAIETAKTAILEGAPIADTLRRSGEFPPLVTHMIGIGEQTGELEPMLRKVADAYDNDVENSVTAMTAILEPLMILGMGGVVFFILLAILMPYLDLSGLKV